MSATVNVASWLPVRAAEDPYRAAIICPAGRDRDGRSRYTRVNYSQLDADSTAIARGLAAIGIRPGNRCVVMIPPGQDFFAVVFALFKAGAVLVAIDPGIGLRNFGHCVGQARPDVFIGIRKAQLARRLFGWGRGSLHTSIAVGYRRRQRHYAGRAHLDLAHLRALGQQATHTTGADLPQARTDDAAAILFTSGSTGAPKGACYSHGNFTAQLEALRQCYAIPPGEIDLATFPLFALYAPALGMTAVVPDMDFTRPAQVDPQLIRAAITDFGVTNLFGSPALLRQVGRQAHAQGWRFPSLKRVVSAGAPVPVRVHRLWQGLLAPGVEIFTPYGATESLPVASIGSRTILEETAAATEQGAGVCVGFPVAGLAVRIIPISDVAIASMDTVSTCPTGTIGEICVCGAQVTQRYFDQEPATQLAKIADGARWWHRMGDLGYLDVQGRLWFCGRKSQRVRTAQGTLYTVQTESRFNAHPAVFRSALVGMGPVGDQQPVLVIECEATVAAAERQALCAELLRWSQTFALPCPLHAVLAHPSFPVDIRHNAKIGREQLARWAARELARTP